MYELPMEVLLRVAYFADLDTVLNLLRIKEFRNSVGSFFKIVTLDGEKSSYFEEFGDLRLVRLKDIAETFTNRDEINLIEISEGFYLRNELVWLLPKNSRNNIVFMEQDSFKFFYDIYHMFNSIVVMNGEDERDLLYINWPDLSYFDDRNDTRKGSAKEKAQRKSDSYQMNFRNIKLYGVTRLYLRCIKRILELESQSLFAPMLEELVIDRGHDGILKIFSDEVLENQLTRLEIICSSVDLSREGQLNKITNFKNLVSANFSNIHNMKNVRFEKLKKVTISLGPSRHGELCVLENVEFPELKYLELTGHRLDGYHHEIKSFQAPKLEIFDLNRSPYACNAERERFKKFSLSSSLHFSDAHTWDIASMICGILRFDEQVLNIHNLSIKRCDGQVGELGINLPQLRELKIQVDFNFREFPKFTKVPNLKKLIVNLGHLQVNHESISLISHIEKYYSHVQHLELFRTSVICGITVKSAGCATFQNLKTLYIHGFFGRDVINTVNLPWRFPNLEELNYCHLPGGDVLPATLTMDFHLPKLRSLNYELYVCLYGPISPCLTIRNCPVLQSVELHGVSGVTIYDRFGSIRYSSVLEYRKTSTVKFDKRDRACKRSSGRVVKCARLR